MSGRTERMVDVGGHRLHLIEQGAGIPVVVLEAGSGMTADGWRTVQEKIAAFTKVVSYDRAGYARSEPGPSPRTAEQVVRELEALLHRSGVSRPYILVGASLGGLFARLFASRHEGDVVGVVLVDARPEDYGSKVQELSDRLLRQGERLIARARTLTRLPLLSRTCRVLVSAFGGRGTSNVVGALNALGHPHQLDAIIDEGRSLTVTEDQVRAQRFLGDVPLVVITHGRPMSFGRLSEDDQRLLEDAWQEAQRESTHLSTKGRLVVAEKAGHIIQFDRPDVIVEAVQDLVTGARSRKL